MMIEEHLTILAWAVPIALCVLAIAFRLGFFLLPEEKKSGREVSFYHLLIVFSLFFLSQFLTASLGLTLLRAFDVYKGVAYGWLDAATILISSLAVLAYTHYGVPQIENFFLKQGKTVKSFFFGMLTLTVCYPAVVVVGQAMRLAVYLLFQAEEIDQGAIHLLKRALESPLLFSVMVFAVIAVVPIVEELLFRGYLQTWLKSFLGRRGAIIWGAVIFSGFHFSFMQGLSNIELLSSLFLLSLFLGFLYEKRENLSAPIGLHMIFNALNVVILLKS